MVYGVCMLTRTQVLFPEDILAALRAEAVRKKTSVSALVRHIVADKVVKTRKMKKRPAAEMLLQMAKHAYKGKVPKDFSTNDDYLYRLP